MHDWVEHLGDSSISGGLKRCLIAISALWDDPEVTLFVRVPSSVGIIAFRVGGDAKLVKDETPNLDAGSHNLLRSAIPAETYYDERLGLLYIRQKRGGHPQAVLRLRCNNRAYGDNAEQIAATRAVLLAATAYFESFNYFSRLQEPEIVESIRKSFKDYMDPVCRIIAEKTFLPIVCFAQLNDGFAIDFQHFESNLGEMEGDRRLEHALRTLDYRSIMSRISEHEMSMIVPKSQFLELFRSSRAVREQVADFAMIASRVSDQWYVTIFSNPRDYELTDADQTINRLMHSQFRNYAGLYFSFNEERYKLLSQQQEFGIEYAHDFTQAARHAAREALNLIFENVEILNMVEADEAVREDAYSEIQKSIAEIDNAYSTIQGLADPLVAKEVVFVSDFFDDLGSVFNKTFARLGIVYHVDIKNIRIRAHEQQLKVAFFNMIQNSCTAFEKFKGGQHPRRIVISLSGRKSRPLQYEDNAGGIHGLKDKTGNPVADLEKSWARGVSGTGGTGFGMHLIKRYLEANDCQIEMLQTGHGTRFLVEIQKVRVGGNE